MYSCSNDIDLTQKPITSDLKQFERLVFSSEQELETAIAAESSTYSNVGVNSDFVSLMSKYNHQLVKNGSASSYSEETNVSYYEALGYDTLVPNLNFAALLNPLGELEVATHVIKITPNGTYKFPKESEDLFNSLFSQDSTLTGQLIGEHTYEIGNGIVLYKTFSIDPKDYILESEGNYELLPDEDDAVVKNLTKAVSEPDYDSFQTFSADRTTLVGKFIQSLIGSTKASTVNFSSKRRVRGSFYFYDYGVYSEIGVQGWTDKKNWIGWSKTDANELRVGWRRIIIKTSVPDYYKQSFDQLKTMTYFPPQMMVINGQRVNVLTLAMPDYKMDEDDFKTRLISLGTKPILDLIKKEYKRPSSELENVHAAIVATRTDLYYLVDNEEVTKYNTRSYTHVFANHWMDISVGWSNTNGFTINGIGQSNATNASAYITVLGKAFNEKKPKLIAGEVQICARFGNDWRGMRIVKRDGK